MVVKRVDERGEGVLVDFDHFVFALVDRALHSVSFVVVHGVSDREPAHEVGDAWFISAKILP